MSNLSENLKKYRKLAHLTQQQVADVIGIKRSAYAYYETGKSSPKLETLKMIASLYNISVDVLMGIKDIDEELGVHSSQPEYDSEWRISDNLNQLSDFEQYVILKVRLMSIDDKQKLVEFFEK